MNWNKCTKCEFKFPFLHLVIHSLSLVNKQLLRKRYTMPGNPDSATQKLVIPIIALIKSHSIVTEQTI